MIVIGAMILGAFLGGATAWRRGGKALDIAQYAGSFGIAFTILGLFLTIIIERMAT